MDVQQLDGPRLEAMSGKTKQLVVFLHGFGADGADLIALGRQWQQMLPDAAFVAPNAPQSCELMPMGYQWFPLKMTMDGVASTPEERWAGAVDAAPALQNFLDQQVQHYGVEPQHMALVGFSQGAMMALHVGLRRPNGLGAIVSYSGMVLGPEHLDEISCKPPVFLAHGSIDDVVPFAVMAPSSEALMEAGIDVSGYVEQGVGHGIDGEAAWLGAEFLKKQLNN
jgi:phospholipase/carboxylesterase